MRKAADGLAQFWLSARSFVACKNQPGVRITGLGNVQALPVTHRAEPGSKRAMVSGQWWGYLSSSWEFFRSQQQPVSKSLVWTWRKKRLGSCLSVWHVLDGEFISLNIWRLGYANHGSWESKQGTVVKLTVWNQAHNYVTHSYQPRAKIDSAGQLGTRKAYTRGRQAHSTQSCKMLLGGQPGGKSTITMKLTFVESWKLARYILNAFLAQFVILRER